MQVRAPQSSYAAKGGRDPAGPQVWPALTAEVAALSSVAELKEWRDDFTVRRQAETPPAFWEALWEALEVREAELLAEAKSRAIGRTLDNSFLTRMADDRA